MTALQVTHAALLVMAGVFALSALYVGVIRRIQPTGVMLAMGGFVMALAANVIGRTLL